MHFAHCHYGSNEPIQRQVMLYKESGWVFAQAGPPLPFEDKNAYLAAKKRERLTANMLKEYGERLGVRFWDPAFFGKASCVMHWSNISTCTTLKTTIIEMAKSAFGPNLKVTEL